MAEDTGERAADKPKKRLGRPPKDVTQHGAAASEKLLQAALAEFVEHGFDGTNTNRISERAGFAPQTFYRWYKDKLTIFLAVFEHWATSDMAQLEALLSEALSEMELAEACVESHRTLLTFKRSLKRLAQDEDQVRLAAKQARLAQISRVRRLCPTLDQEETAALLIELDHLCEALAEGEFAELGLDGRFAYAQLAEIIGRLRPH